MTHSEIGMSSFRARLAHLSEASAPPTSPAGPDPGGASQPPDPLGARKLSPGKQSVGPGTGPTPETRCPGSPSVAGSQPEGTRAALVVSLASNPSFIGREAILEALHPQLDTHRAVALIQSSALSRVPVRWSPFQV